MFSDPEGAEVSLDEEIAALLQPLHQRLEALEGQEENLIAELAQLRADKKRLNELIRAATPASEREVGQRGRPPKKPYRRLADGEVRNRPVKVSEGRLALVIEAMKNADLSDFTKLELTRKLNFPPSTISEAIYILRDRGLIRAVGKERTLGSPIIYRMTEKANGAVS